MLSKSAHTNFANEKPILYYTSDNSNFETQKKDSNSGKLCATRKSASTFKSKPDAQLNYGISTKITPSVQILSRLLFFFSLNNKTAAYFTKGINYLLLLLLWANKIYGKEIIIPTIIQHYSIISATTKLPLSIQKAAPYTFFTTRSVDNSAPSFATTAVNQLTLNSTTKHEAKTSHQLLVLAYDLYKSVKTEMGALQSAPTITSLSTLSGCPGSDLVINGTNLSGAQTVTIGGSAAVIISTTATSITVKVGTGTTGNVTVSSPAGTASSTDIFTVLPATLGTNCNPFTNVNQVTDFTPNGSYFFKFGGTSINTFVENGWVLILNDVGSPSSQPIASNVLLDKTVRGKLSNAVLANLGDFNSINIKSSGGEVDAIISEPTLVNRIKQGKTLHTGLSDNAINNAWFGSASSVSLNADATCTTSFADDLSVNVFHTCGANDGFTWIPINAERKITLASGNVANNVGFGLWVKSTSAVAGANGASLWLKGNDGLFNSGTTITDWLDQTRNNVFSVIGSPGYKPNAVNFNAAARFDNEETWNVLPASRLEGNTAITYVDGFAVYFYETEAPTFRFGTFLGSVGAPVSPADLGVGIFASAGSRSAYASNGVIGLNIHFVDPIAETNTRYKISNLDVELAVAPYGTGRSNGIEQTILNGSNPTLRDFPSIAFTPMIGGTTNPTVSPGQPGFRHMKGEVAEIILYPRSLPLTDKQKIESYLAIKYGITLGSNSVAIEYINGLGNIVWPANAIYKFDVFGIGRDDMSTLNQSSSNSINTGSGDGTGQSGKGNIVISNPSSLENGDFLLIGHDNGSLGEQATDVPSGFNLVRIGREWKVQRTGDVGTVNLAFDFNGITVSGGTTDVNNYRLLVDVDGDGDFTTGTVQQIIPNSFGSPKIIFNALDATQLPNNAVFTFATGPANVLPLQLLQFKAIDNECVAIVNWSTTNELGVAKIELEVKSKDKDWENIFTTIPKNNPNAINQYAFTYDHNAEIGIKLLRLKMTDLDGKINYSKVLSVQCNLPENIKLFPNPSAHLMTLNGTKKHDMIFIFNSSGQLLKKIDGVEKYTSISIDELPKGTYLLQLNRNGEITFTKKFVKL